jgi:hypothetical protein
MELILVKRAVCSAIAASVAATLVACGGGGGSGSTASTSSTPGTTESTTGTLPIVVSDASSDDWATIGVKILSIALIPQGGGTAVTVYTAPTPAPTVNLEELDQIAEILGNVSVPTGTYTGATLTISGNPGDVALVVAANPESGFAGTAGESIPSSQIQIQGTQGSTGNLTVPVNVNFVAPLTVTTSQNNALDLEFDLSHPAFIVAHTPPSADGATVWAVNFEGPLRHHLVADMRRLVLRHTYGTVTAVSSDNSTITLDKDYPTLPVVNPETAVATSQALQVEADSTNGTIFYDLDAQTTTKVTSFSAQAASLAGKYVRIAARYQQNGTLVAVRVWASSSFNNVWVSPEGHVLHVNPSTNVITVLNESGVGVPLTVNASTQFFFRAPQNPAADATPISTGTALLAGDQFVRGFKVHASVVDPLATPLVAQTIDIETAAYSGTLSAANSTGFTDTRAFPTATDDYTTTLDYVSSTTTTGAGASGTAVTGFQYWNFAYPTLATTGANAIGDFVTTTNGGVSFGGTVGAVSAWGVSDAVWADPANPTGWAVPWTILEPTPLPLGTVTTAYANNSFAMSVLGGTTPATVDVSTTSGSATLVYQIDRSNNVVTVSREDITTTAGLTAMTNGLTNGAPVKVYGIPTSGGTLQAYVLMYYTGTTMPAQ